MSLNYYARQMKKEESALKNTDKLTKTLLNSRNKPEFCDLKIKTNDGEIAASKFILSLRSEYFRVMFSSNFVESSSGTIKLPYSKVVVNKVIIYLYTGEMVFKDPKLGDLLDVLDLLRMMNLSEEFKQLERYASDSIFNRKFSLSDCLKNLDKSSNMRMEFVGKKMMDHLRCNLDKLSLMKDVVGIGILSEAMIIKLLEDGDDGDDEYSDEEYDEEYQKEIEEEKKMREREKTLFRFKIFAKWLSTNPMAAEEKAKALEMFDFDNFTIENLASTVRESGLYPSDKIIERMERVLDEKQQDLEIRKKQLEDIKQEKKEALSGKDQDVNKPMKEKNSEEEEDLNRKRKLEVPTPEGKISKL